MDLDASRGRGVEDDLRLRGCGRQRLVDDHVQATPGRFEGEGDVGAVGRCDDDEVDVIEMRPCLVGR